MTLEHFARAWAHEVTLELSPVGNVVQTGEHQCIGRSIAPQTVTERDRDKVEVGAGFAAVVRECLDAIARSNGDCRTGR
jgi:hypothetical protein